MTCLATREARLQAVLESRDLTPDQVKQVAMLYGIPMFEARKMSSAFDTQEGGSHYKDMVIQPTEYIMKNNLGFCEGNVVKYVSRYKNKNGVEDLKKARHYLDMLIESAGGGGNEEKVSYEDMSTYDEPVQWYEPRYKHTQFGQTRL